MQAMPSIVEADRRCHHASDDAQMGRLFSDDSLASVSLLVDPIPIRAIPNRYRGYRRIDSFSCACLKPREAGPIASRTTGFRGTTD